MTTPPAPGSHHPVQGNPYGSPPQGNPYATSYPPQAAQPYAAQPGHPQPYAAQPGHPQPAAPYAHPQPYGAPHPGAPLMCRFCGGAPAVPVAFRAHRGILILMTFRKLDGPMCATCGLGAYRTLTTETLWQGWWSPFSLFLFTPFTLLYNLVAARKVKKLQPPVPGQHGQQIDPGVPVHRRPLAYVALVPVLWLLFMIVSGLTSGS
jgi:hypothetical protein